MAKGSVIQREFKRATLIQKYAQKREQLKALIVKMSEDEDTRWQAQLELQKLPKNSSIVRRQRRCRITGRAHGFYRKFGLARNKLREAAMRGDIPGLTKASW